MSTTRTISLCTHATALPPPHLPQIHPPNTIDERIRLYVYILPFPISQCRWWNWIKNVVNHFPLRSRSHATTLQNMRMLKNTAKESARSGLGRGGWEVQSRAHCQSCTCLCMYMSHTLAAPATPKILACTIAIHHHHCHGCADPMAAGGRAVALSSQLTHAPR